MSKSLRGRGETNFTGRRVRQMVRRKRLDQTRLSIAARAEDHALSIGGRASPDNHVNGALFARIFARRSSGLEGVRHFGELLLLLRFRERSNLFFVHFLSCRYAFHDLAIQQPTHRADVGYLRMVLEPYRLGKAAPGERKLSLQIARDYNVITRRAWPRLVVILLQVVA